MEQPKTIHIDNIEYVRKDAVMPETSGEIRIVILQRGFVFVGQWSQDGSRCTLKNAACIRKWGTTKGLGEIALGGPTAKTVLDPCPPVTFHELTIVATIDCVEAKWKSKL